MIQVFVNQVLPTVRRWWWVSCGCSIVLFMYLFLICYFQEIRSECLGWGACDINTSITKDIWSDRRMRSYLSVTAHFIETDHHGSAVNIVHQTQNYCTQNGNIQKSKSNVSFYTESHLAAAYCEGYNKKLLWPNTSHLGRDWAVVW